LEGLAIALANIDPIIALIKASPSPAEAKEQLMGQGWQPGNVLAMLERSGETASRPEDLADEFGLRNGLYHLSPSQAQAILDLRLHRLTGMEHDKLLAEYSEKLAEITEYLDILANPARLMAVITEELQAVKEEFGDQRRTEIISSRHDLTVEDLITEEDRVVTISRGGYAKSQPLSDYQAQRRGGTGKSATAVKEEDFIEHLLIANTHDVILCFSNAGKVYWLKVYQIPVASRVARGRPLVNLLPLDGEERITSILPVHQYDESQFVVMATARGTVKKTPLIAFSRPRSAGLRALELEPGDHLVGTAITDGSCDIMLFSSNGKCMRFKESDVRAMGRTAKGVRGIRLTSDHKLISLIIPQPDKQILTASYNGYGKRSDVAEFPLKGRGGQGVIAQQCSERNGDLVGAIQVSSGEEMMLISDQGKLVRIRVDEVSQSGRNTQGVTLIRLKDGEHLVGIERIEESDSGELGEGDSL
jgi:DNA gyrase subunit A